MKIRQVEWFVSTCVGNDSCLHETYNFWLEEGAKPENYYQKKLGARHQVVSHGLTGETRELDLDLVESMSDTNCTLRAEPAPFTSAYDSTVH